MYRVVEIERIRQEARNVKTFRFADDSSPLPGQFYMIWIPGVDEFPMSISYTGALKGFTVKKIGRGTSRMHDLEPGDKIWIRGPYGRGFHIDKRRKSLVVGGGSGMATLGPLIEEIKGDVIIAARTKEELIFTERFSHLNPWIATDDGSAGFKGYATDLARKLVEEREYDIIYACGPEQMIKGLVDLAFERDIDIQVSLERLMKCGIGICDSCSINGYRVCVDGPVFFKEELKNMDELGKVRRGWSGKREVVR